ncbi:glutathione S-transferase N-terminal domain-containing protein [Agrobacterium sp. P15N1-A]|uniref:glutathione S-transferase N-terminal domain-containing protein n=1 Tax=Agrobacterium sp. P15N1-A TaxID=3342820 RepID=UPI0037D3BEE0
MKLLYAVPSPYSRKVRVVAHELGVPLELVAVNAMSDDVMLGAVNPLNRVPALLLDDGKAFFDSPLISEYLDVTYGPQLFPLESGARWQALLQQALGDGIMDAAVPRRHETLRPAEQQSAERIRLYRRTIDQTLARLEQTVAELSCFHIGTISIACALTYLDFRFAGDAWRVRCPTLGSWLDEVLAKPSMQATLFE